MNGCDLVSSHSVLLFGVSGRSGSRITWHTTPPPGQPAGYNGGETGTYCNCFRDNEICGQTGFPACSTESNNLK